MPRETELNTSAVHDDFIYEADTENNGIRIVKYVGNSRHVEIPREIDGKKTVSLGAYVFAETEDAGAGRFKAVVAGNGQSTPYEIILPYTLKYISYCAFYGCENITEINIPETVTEIGSSAFAFCRNLRRIKLPAGVDDVSRSTFRNCTGLKEAVISGNVRTIGFIAFENCVSLERIILPDSVRTIEMRAFCGCKSLRHVKLPDCGITFGNGVFAESGLIDMNIPETGYIPQAMFHKCKELEQVTVARGLSEIGEDAFSGCEALESVLFPQGVKKIGSRAFCGCEALERLSPIDTDAVYGDDVWKDTQFY
ncbi:MAG: leucine-rich repeat domain-containing protein [Ruminococcus sp.]|nr:leucine-rich repeat domain-containing protein [Ruminococcus sp.]